MKSSIIKSILVICCSLLLMATINLAQEKPTKKHPAKCKCEKCTDAVNQTKCKDGCECEKCKLQKMKPEKKCKSDCKCQKCTEAKAKHPANCDCTKCKISEKGIWNSHCPVGENPVDPAVKTMVHKDKTIGFCCPKCIKSFEKDPEKYLKKFDKNGNLKEKH